MTHADKSAPRSMNHNYTIRLCSGFIPVAVRNILTKSNLGNKEFILVHKSRLLSISWRKSQRQELETAGHVTSLDRSRKALMSSLPHKAEVGDHQVKAGGREHSKATWNNVIRLIIHSNVCCPEPEKGHHGNNCAETRGAQWDNEVWHRALTRRHFSLLSHALPPQLCSSIQQSQLQTQNHEVLVTRKKNTTQTAHLHGTQVNMCLGGNRNQNQMKPQRLGLSTDTPTSMVQNRELSRLNPDKIYWESNMGGLCRKGWFGSWTNLARCGHQQWHDYYGGNQALNAQIWGPVYMRKPVPNTVKPIYKIYS